MKFFKKKEHFFYLLIASFVLVSSTALALSTNLGNIYTEVTKVLTKNERTFPDNPKLTGTEPFPVISAQAVMAIDLNSGVSLYEKNPDEALLPASTTKIVTSLVALNTYPLDEVLTVGELSLK